MPGDVIGAILNRLPLSIAAIVVVDWILIGPLKDIYLAQLKNGTKMQYTTFTAILIIVVISLGAVITSLMITTKRKQLDNLTLIETKENNTFSA